jgi:hypothetical protein
VFHHRHRRHPLGETFPWTDYRYSNSPGFRPHFGRGWHSPFGAAGFGSGWGNPWHQRRNGQLLRKLLIGLALVAIAVYVIQRLSGSRRSSNWF